MLLSKLVNIMRLLSDVNGWLHFATFNAHLHLLHKLLWY